MGLKKVFVFIMQEQLMELFKSISKTCEEIR